MDVDPRLVEAYFAFMEAGSLLEQAMEAQLRHDADISYVQFALLVKLAEAPEGRLRMSELADGAVHSRSGMTYQARALENAGLVRRGRSPRDERAIDVAITPAGVELLQSVTPAHVEVVTDRLLAPIPADGIERFADTIIAIRDHMRARAGQTPGNREYLP